MFSNFFILIFINNVYLFNFIRPGEVLFKSGQEEELALYLLESGQVQIIEDSGYKIEKQVATIKAGETLGFVGFFTKKEIYTAKS